MALLSVSACQTGGGYGRYGSTAQQAAQLPPSNLSDPVQGPPAPATQAQMPPGTGQPQPQTHAPVHEPVKVALLLPLTGKHAGLGQAMLNASQIALFDAGDNNFELIPIDTEATPGGAAGAASVAIQQGAQLILGPIFADSVRAVKPVAAQANVNVIAFSTDWTLAGGNTFIMGFLPFDQVDRIVSYAASKNLAQVGVIAPQTDYGRAVVGAYKTAAQRNGITTIDSVEFPAGSTNLAPLVQKFARYTPPAAGPAVAAPVTPPPFNAVLMPAGGETALSIASLLSNYNMPPQTVKRLGTGLFDDPALSVEKNLDGAWFAAPSPRLRENFEKRFQSTYRQAPPRLASLAYDATALAAVLAKRGLSAGGQPSFDRNSIANPNGFAGIDGIFRFRADGTAERGLAVLEFNRGSVKIIDEAPRTFQKPLSQ